jgi:pyridoxamine 5'-phosphate oxidase
MSNNKIFSEKTIDPDPVVQFRVWYNEHLNAGIEIPESVTLATSSSNGRVSARTILLKEFSDEGFVFFTNYNSRKGTQLLSNSYAALLFYWPESGRQVRIEGITDKISDTDSDTYFRTRPRESQLAAWASEQSSVIPDRDHLDNLYNFYQKKFSGKSVERPPYWGGFRLIPVWFEFWQNGDYRLHDRLTYVKIKSLWKIDRLAP